MEIIYDLENYKPNWEGCVLTMGDFDGMHRGHRKLIETTIQHAEKLMLTSVLLTYHPSPKMALKKLNHDENIYTQSEKIILLKSFSLQAVFFLPFNKDILNITAKSFLQNILIKQLKVKKIIVGFDHKFGKNRHGNYKYLSLAKRKYNFKLKNIKPVKTFRRAVSSSHIRKLLKEGNIEAANKLLFIPYFIQGTVILGKQRGRQLGTPTANLEIFSEKLLPREGVYFCITKFEEQIFNAVVNIGRNPTFGNRDVSVEAHLLNFDKDIYDKQVFLFFIKRIRDEMKFLNIEQLKEQINTDVKQSKKMAIKFHKKGDVISNFFSDSHFSISSK